MHPDLDGAVWRKSSHSGGNGGECVELADLAHSTGVRDSKNPTGAVLIFTGRSAGRFLAAVKGGRFG
ncbi:DUF397 domain-containing protein [Umezawaea sp. Da 62-37]|uniref:DUF397 domain-containing protein n=1 Tax=Umezawaea sp. Da 62-37 TaxID=3075927 RepID=UPI0028F70B3A|nr:DUF397 domain-containing protein [Umezawaea sp. Da 62-37]WNV91684.1 DUF397 domain-containing protein [Umezawaea sp. Da 62-37]